MYQLLVEAHLGQVLLEDLAVHVHALLPDIVVPVDLRIHALSPCAQSPITELRHVNKQGLISSMQTACCHCSQDHRMPDRTLLRHQAPFCVRLPQGTHIWACCSQHVPMVLVLITLLPYVGHLHIFQPK